MGLCSTQAKVEGILPKAAWHWVTYNSVNEQSPLRTRRHPIVCWPSCRLGIPVRWLYIFPHFVGMVLSGTLTDVNECINHRLWRRIISPHRYTVGGIWKGSIPEDFEGNMNYQAMCSRRLWDWGLSMYGPVGEPWGTCGGSLSWNI